MYATKPPARPPSAATDARRKADALRDAALTLRRIRAERGQAPAHRAMKRLQRGPGTVLLAATLAIVLCMALAWARPQILSFWNDCLGFWLSRLSLPLRTELLDPAAGHMRFTWTGGVADMHMPGPNLKAGTGVVLALLFGWTYFFSDANLPLRYLVRIVCGVHGLALLFFWLAPSQFPYTTTDHLGDMVHMGLLLLFAIPVMLAVGYYLLPATLPTKIFHSLLILTYFIVLVPHQVVLHALVLHYGSILCMPLLYICFGTVFDVLLFIALYSWVVSRLPRDGAATDAAQGE